MSRPIALVSGSFNGTGRSAALELIGKFNFSLQFNAGTATVTLDRSYDGGGSWITTTKPDLTQASFTADVDGVGEEPEHGVLYSFNCSAFTSGPVDYRLSR